VEKGSLPNVSFSRLAPQPCSAALPRTTFGSAPIAFRHKMTGARRNREEAQHERRHPPLMLHGRPALYATLSCVMVLGCGGDDNSDGSKGGAAATSASSSGSAADSAAGTGTGGSGSGQTAGAAGGAGPQNGGRPNDGQGGKSAGCGSTATLLEDQNQEIRAGSTTRVFQLSLPPSYASDRAYGLIFTFHGRTGSTGSRYQYNFENNERANNYILIHGQGDEYLGEGMYGPEYSSSDTREKNGIQVAYFDALYAWANAHLCFDKNRVFATGFSQGGYITATLGCSRGALLRAIAPAQGGVYDGQGCTGSVGALFGYSESDVHAQGLLGARDLLRAAGSCGSEASPFSAASPCFAYNGCASDAGVVWCPHPGGHVWPDFLSAAILEFFDGFQ